MELFFDITATPRYADACLSKLLFPHEDMVKMNEWKKECKNYLILTGNYGVGKTYFGAALVNSFKGTNQKTGYTTASRLFSWLKEEMNRPGGSVEYKISTMASYELIFILDEFGNSMMTDWQKEVLTQFIDERTMNILPTVICSNTWMKDMSEKFNGAIASRLKRSTNTIIECHGEDLRLRGL